MKLKDGYKKLIGTTYTGSSDLILLSDGGNIQYTTAATADTIVQRNSNSELRGKLRYDATSSYLEGRVKAPVANIHGTDYYQPLISSKVLNGSWEIVTYQGLILFLYITDEDVNSGSNRVAYSLKFPKVSGTVLTHKNAYIGTTTVLTDSASQALTGITTVNNVKIQNRGVSSDGSTTVRNIYSVLGDTDADGNLIKNEWWLKPLRGNFGSDETDIPWITGGYAAGIAFGGGDTKGVMSVRYDQPDIRFAGANPSTLWWVTVKGSHNRTYSLDQQYINRTYNNTVYPFVVANSGNTTGDAHLYTDINSGYGYNPSNGVIRSSEFLGNLDGSYINKLTGYSKATTKADITITDSLNTALGKLEFKADAAYDLVKGAYDGDGTIENLAEILKVLKGVKDTDTIQAIIGKYLPLTGGTLTGNLNFNCTGAEKPGYVTWTGGTYNQRILIIDSSSDKNTFTFLQSTDSGATWSNLCTITADGRVLANKFVTTNGTSSQFVKGDGSLDSNIYATTTSLGNYVTLDTDLTITGLKTFESNSSTTGVSLILKNKSWTGGISTAIDFYNGYNYTVPNARISTLMNGNGKAGGTLIFYTQTKHESTNPNPNGLTERLRIDDNDLTKITGFLTVTDDLTATKFVTKDGTSSQFVKGDGNLDSNSYLIKDHATHTTAYSRCLNVNGTHYSFWSPYSSTVPTIYTHTSLIKNRLSYTDGTNMLFTTISYLPFEYADNNGYPVFLLIAELTNWAAGTDSLYTLVGSIYGIRNGNQSNTSVYDIVANCTSYSSGSKVLLYTNLYSAGSAQPYVVEYDGKKYLALKKIGSGTTVYFVGRAVGLSNTYITLNVASDGTLPNGLTILHYPTLANFAINTTKVYDGTSERDLLHTGNYTTYTVKKDGTGASGNWSINVTGYSKELSPLTNNSNKVFTRAHTDSIKYDYCIPNDHDSIKNIATGYNNAILTIPRYHTTEKYNSYLLFTGQGMYLASRTNDTNWAWERIITSNNYTKYTVKKDGTGATGDWDINVTGTATSLANTLFKEKDDLNDFTEAGVYSSKQTSVCKSLVNKPSGMPEGECVLEVIHCADNTHLILKFIAKNGPKEIIYYRAFTNGSWSIWHTIARRSDIPTKISELTNDSTFIKGSALGGTYQPIYVNAQSEAVAGTSYAKAIKDITRSGNVFTYTCIDGTTGTFNQQDTTYALTALKQSLELQATKGWYRIATSPIHIYPCVGDFEIEGSIASYHTVTKLNAAINYSNNPGITVINTSHYANAAITLARIVYHTTYVKHYAYLEVYLALDKAITLTTKLLNGYGWTLIQPVAGSIPEEYTSKTVSLVNNTLTTTGDLMFEVNLDNSGSWNSPAVIFKRGVYDDDFIDWKLYVDGGILKIQNTTENDATFKDIISFGTQNTPGIIASQFITAPELTSNGDIYLKSTGTNPSGSLVFLRGGIEDTAVDWKLQCIGGAFYVYNRHGSSSWNEVLKLSDNISKKITTTYTIEGNITGTASKLTSTQIINTEFSLSLATWTDTGYTFEDLATGTYAIQVTSDTNLVASGIMSVYNNLEDTIGDEIPLHVYGTGWRPYLRTYQNKLQISSNDVTAEDRTVTIKIAQIL